MIKKHLALLSLLCIDDQVDLQNSNEHNGDIKNTSEVDKRQQKVWFGPKLISSFRNSLFAYTQQISKMAFINEMKTPKTTVSVSLLRVTPILGVVM
jgi:hypothetical protein